MMETESGGEHQSQGTRGSDQGVQDGGDWEGGEHGEHADGQDGDSHKVNGSVEICVTMETIVGRMMVEMDSVNILIETTMVLHFMYYHFDKLFWKV